MNHPSSRRYPVSRASLSPARCYTPVIPGIEWPADNSSKSNPDVSRNSPKSLLVAITRSTGRDAMISRKSSMVWVQWPVSLEVVRRIPLSRCYGSSPFCWTHRGPRFIAVWLFSRGQLPTDQTILAFSAVFVRASITGYVVPAVSELSRGNSD